MKKLFKNTTAILCVMILIFSIYYMPVKAADTASISISSATVTNNDKVEVSVTVSSSSDMLLISLWVSYDTNILEYVSGATGGGGGSLQLKSGDGGTDVYRSVTYKLVFNAKSAGSANISINKSHVQCFVAGGVDNMSFNDASGVVTVNAPASYSSNNNLSSLAISPGAISPAFSSNVTSYTASVGSDCAALVVSAITEDSTATVSVTGKTMDPGTNTTKITVKAQNGSTKTYVITTMKEAAVNNNPATEAQTTPAVAAVTTTFNGENYNVISNLANHALPAGYTATTFDFNGQSVTVGKGTNGLTIMYLEKADGSVAGNFYVYDTASKTFSLLSTVTQPALTYTILPITSSMEIPDNYTKSTLTINGNNVDILIPAGTDVKYCLFYGVDSTGKAGWYRFDYTEQTAQKYYGDDLSSSVVTSSNTGAQSGNLKLWKIISAVAAVAASVFLLIMIVLAFKLKSKESDNDNDNDGDDDDGHDIFSTIAYNELQNNDNTDNDNTKNKEDHNVEIASEIGAEAAAAMELDFEDNEVDSEELYDENAFELEVEETFEDSDQDIELVSDLDNDEDNDISDLKDILADDDDDDIYSSKDEDDDDFEFLDIEDLEDM